MPLNGIVATVFNGSSFVAKNTIARLCKLGCQVVIAYRGSGYDEFRLRVCGGLGQVYFAEYNLKDEDSLRKAMQHSSVVVNLVGKQNETRNFSFFDVHVDGPKRMARIAKEVGVSKFIHFSALNCTPDPEPKVLKNGSQFLKSKYYGELGVREEFPEAVIFRPADITGEQDNFLNHFTEMQRSLYGAGLPLYDYYHGVIKQPVLLADVINGIEKSIFDDSANGKTFQAVGPHRYNFRELISYMKAVSGSGEDMGYHLRNLRFHFLMRLMMFYWDKAYKYPLLTWERVERDMTTDIVDPKLPTLQDLGVKLTPIELNIETHGYHRPRLHRISVPYGAPATYERPQRLDAAVA